MTELEQYCKRLYNAMMETNPLLMLRKIKNTALLAATTAEANSILTEADKFNTNIIVTNKIVTSADESITQARILSYMCLQKLSEIHKCTYAYKHGLLNEHCDIVSKLDKQSIHKLHNLSVYLKENVAPFIHALTITNSNIVKQHVMRKIIMALDKVG